MSNRTNEIPYYRTIPSREASHEPDDDTIYLLGEGEMIEMSPEISTTDDIDPNPKMDEQIAAADQPKEEEEDEEAILRRRLMEKKREKEVAKVDKEPKQPSRKEQQSLQPEKERREQQRYHGSSSSSDHPKRERIVWKDSERKPTSYSSSHHPSDPSGRQERRERTDQPSRKIDVREKFTTSAPSSSHHTQRMDDRRDKQHSSTSISHHRKEKRDEDKRKEEEQARRDEKVKKRPRMVSDSSGEEPKKAPKREEKEQHMHAHHRQPQQKNMENPVDDVEEKEGTSPVQSITPLEKEMAMDLVINEQPQYAKKPKKYSKFESSPEQSEDDQNEDEPIYSEDELKTDLAMNEEKTLKEEEMADEDEEMDGLVDSDLPENKEFDKLTDQDKALLTPEKLTHMEAKYQRQLISSLPVYYPGISGCRSVVEYECLNKISEGTFGVVYRAQERRTDEIVALKRLKMEKEHQGFPITSLREINMLLKCGTHKNVLNVREVVVGSSMDKIYMVMEYVEHDLKSLMELMKSRNKKWTISQVKTLLHQLLSGIEHMHNEYVIHRDLKTSNLLLSHGGILKIGDFGLAREFGEPIKPYTPVVVTLWYRSPELLLGTKLYSTPVDMWSVGCIFGEFLKLDPMFPGRNEIDQLQKIFKEVGTPNEDIWPGCMQLPGMKTGVFADTPYNQLRRKFASELPDDDGYELFNKLLALDPKKRLSAKQALSNRWFLNDPKPTPPSSFPTWPAKSEHNKKPPNEPVAPRTKPVGGFTLKFDVPKF